MARVLYGSMVGVRYRVTYIRSLIGPDGKQIDTSSIGSGYKASGTVLVTNNGRSPVRLIRDGVKIYALLDGSSSSSSGTGGAAGGTNGGVTGRSGTREVLIGLASCSAGGRSTGAVTVTGSGGGVSCTFSSLPLPDGAVRLFARATVADGPFDSDPVPLPKPASPVTPTSSQLPGQCAFVSDSFFEPPGGDPSGLVAPRSIAPNVLQRVPGGTAAFNGKAPDATDEGGAQRVCDDTATFDYMATFGSFPGDGCGTYSVSGWVEKSGGWMAA